jgi:hypothetical protein
MNAALLDSAISFAIHNETKTDHDLRIANLKAMPMNQITELPVQ